MMNDDSNDSLHSFIFEPHVKFYIHSEESPKKKQNKEIRNEAHTIETHIETHIETNTKRR